MDVSSDFGLPTESPPSANLGLIAVATRATIATTETARQGMSRERGRLLGTCVMILLNPRVVLVVDLVRVIRTHAAVRFARSESRDGSTIVRSLTAARVAGCEASFQRCPLHDGIVSGPRSERDNHGERRTANTRVSPPMAGFAEIGDLLRWTQ